MNLKRDKKEIPKLNLIPILDAVFIFIFFLLMSAQFVDIYEVGSDAPSIKTTDSIKDDRPPLNLILDIRVREILIKKGLNESLVAKINRTGEKEDLLKLNKVLIDIKQTFMEERSVIFRPKTTVKYQELIIIMDSVKSAIGKQKLISGVTSKGIKQTSTQLFDQIIYETIN
jgi:biopolymer transport protein ExbD